MSKILEHSHGSLHQFFLKKINLNQITSQHCQNQQQNKPVIYTLMAKAENAAVSKVLFYLVCRRTSSSRSYCPIEM